jgi:hypothetical protein
MTDFEFEKLNKFFKEKNLSELLPEYDMFGMSISGLLELFQYRSLNYHINQVPKTIEGLKKLLIEYEIDPDNDIYFQHIYFYYIELIQQGSFVKAYYSKDMIQYYKELIDINEFSNHIKMKGLSLDIISKGRALKLKSKLLIELFFDQYLMEICKKSKLYHEKIFKYSKDQTNIEKLLPVRRPPDIIKLTIRKLDKNLLNFIYQFDIDFKSMEKPKSIFNKSPETFIHDFLVTCDLHKYIIRDSFEKLYNNRSYTNKTEFSKKQLF